MARLEIDGIDFQAETVPLLKVSLLVIRGKRGMLGCGYFSLEAAEKFDDALAIVTGVSSYDDMLAAEVKKVSTAAAKLGVKIGQTGREALLRMK